MLSSITATTFILLVWVSNSKMSEFLQNRFVTNLETKYEISLYDGLHMMGAWNDLRKYTKSKQKYSFNQMLMLVLRKGKKRTKRILCVIFMNGDFQSSYHNLSGISSVEELYKKNEWTEYRNLCLKHTFFFHTSI